MQKRAAAGNAAPTILFLALVVWVGAVFMFVGTHGTEKPAHPKTHQAVVR